MSGGGLRILINGGAGDGWQNGKTGPAPYLIDPAKHQVV